MTNDHGEQEDGLALRRVQGAHVVESPGSPSRNPDDEQREGDRVEQPAQRVGDDWHLLLEFTLPSEPGNERQAMERVTQVVQDLNLSDRRREHLLTAVSEGTMNAMEHGNHYRSELTVMLRVFGSDQAVKVQITDRGGGQKIPEPAIPNLEAKMAGLQASRGWGLFLIKNMVDEMRVVSDENTNTLEIVLYLEGVIHGGENA